MNTQPERTLRSTGAKKPAAAQSKPNATPDARHDTTLVQMATAEVTPRDAARRAMISEAAYHRARKRGFEPGHEVEDWLAAEAQIAHGLSLSELSPAEPGSTP